MSAPVFLSYAKDDEATAQAIARRLQQAYNTRTWLYVSDAGSGESMLRRIQEAVSEASAVIAILSEQSTKSPWLLFEIGVAFGMRKPVVALLVGEPNRKDLPDWLRTVQSIDARERSLQEAVDEISQRLAEPKAG